LFGKSQSKGKGGKYKSKFEINIKINRRETVYEYADSNEVGRDGVK
jgi:hypothetical protein